MDSSLKKMIDAMTPKQREEVEAYIEQCDMSEDEAGEKGEMAEMRSVHAKPKTMMHNSYRGRK